MEATEAIRLGRERLVKVNEAFPGATFPFGILVEYEVFESLVNFGLQVQQTADQHDRCAAKIATIVSGERLLLDPLDSEGGLE